MAPSVRTTKSAALKTSSKSTTSKSTTRSSAPATAKGKAAQPVKCPLKEEAGDGNSQRYKVSLEQQQKLLGVFATAFASLLSLESLTSTLQPLLQQVKQHLYNRAFDEAFGRLEYLEAYAARWSPSRALCYAQIFREVIDYIDVNIGQRPVPPVDAMPLEHTSKLKTVCLGGGAGAEVCALAGLYSLLINQSGIAQNNGDDERPSMQVTAIDMAKWNAVLESLRHALTTPPPLSKYASSAAKAANVEVIHPSAFDLDFFQFDLLKTATSETLTECFCEPIRGANLITLMFTLNELYTVSVPAAQQFLFELTSAARTGSLLLVVDSPGSYSTVTINGQDKRYPMHWLMDHTLLSTMEKVAEHDGTADVNAARAATTTPQWEKLVTDESRWFRLPDGLRYPLELENMRYQMHLYRRC